MTTSKNKATSLAVDNGVGGYLELMGKPEKTSAKGKLLRKASSGEKREIDITRYQGKEYIDFLLGDCEDKIKFIKPNKQEIEYGFGKSYDYDDNVCKLWPKFDYEVLDQEQIKMEEELKDFKDEILGDNDSIAALEESLKSINKKSSVVTLPNVTADELLDFVYIPEQLSPEEFAEEFGHEMPDDIDIMAGPVFDSCTTGIDLSAKRGLDDNPRIRTGLKNATKLGWMGTRNKKGFVANRNLRREMQSWGLDIESLEAEASDERVPQRTKKGKKGLLRRMLCMN